MGRVADLAMGYPGYWGMIPRENGFLPEILFARLAARVVGCVTALSERCKN